MFVLASDRAIQSVPLTGIFEDVHICDLIFDIVEGNLIRAASSYSGRGRAPFNVLPCLSDSARVFGLFENDSWPRDVHFQHIGRPGGRE
jgi:hypothetical protein